MNVKVLDVSIEINGRHGHLTADEIKAAVEQLFKVKVAKVTTAHVLGKKKRGGLRSVGRTRDWKKAYVTLAEGKIDFLENL